MPKRQKRSVLSSEEQDELYTWLTRHNINPAHIRREFTDVQPTARLLLRYYPELVDINFYPRRNSVQSKISNWELFNKRVLAKLGVKLTHADIEQVSRSTPGSIDVLLFRIMKLHNCQRFNCTDGTTRLTKIVRGDDAADDADSNATLNPAAAVAGGVAGAAGVAVNTMKTAQSINVSVNTADSRRLKETAAAAVPDHRTDIVIVKVAKRIGNIVKKMPKRMIALRTYIEAVRQLKRKESTARFMNQKIAHLENLVSLKLEYIDELRSQIARIHADRAKLEPKIPTPDRVMEYLMSTADNQLQRMTAGGVGNGGVGNGGVVDVAAALPRERRNVRGVANRKVRNRRKVNRTTMASLYSAAADAAQTENATNTTLHRPSSPIKVAFSRAISLSSNHSSSHPVSGKRALTHTNHHMNLVTL